MRLSIPTPPDTCPAWPDGRHKPRSIHEARECAEDNGVLVRVECACGAIGETVIMVGDVSIADNEWSKEL